MRRGRWLPLLLVLGLTACGGRATRPEAAATPLPTLDPAQVARGRAVYLQECAACHGVHAEGVPNWATPGPDGLHPASAHDDSGHTWHHSDRVLYETIRDGMGDPLRPNSPLRMPAFGDKLPDADLRAVIAYFKSLWSAEHRQYQQEETAKDFAPTPTPY